MSQISRTLLSTGPVKALLPSQSRSQFRKMVDSLHPPAIFFWIDKNNRESIWGIQNEMFYWWARGISLRYWAFPTLPFCPKCANCVLIEFCLVACRISGQNAPDLERTGWWLTLMLQLNPMNVDPDPNLQESLDDPVVDLDLPKN